LGLLDLESDLIGSTACIAACNLEGIERVFESVREPKFECHPGTCGVVTVFDNDLDATKEADCLVVCGLNTPERPHSGLWRAGRRCDGRVGRHVCKPWEWKGWRSFGGSVEAVTERENIEVI
jgi:hypothetical protein